MCRQQLPSYWSGQKIDNAFNEQGSLVTGIIGVSEVQLPKDLSLLVGLSHEPDMSSFHTDTRRHKPQQTSHHTVTMCILGPLSTPAVTLHSDEQESLIVISVVTDAGACCIYASLIEGLDESRAQLAHSSVLCGVQGKSMMSQHDGNPPLNKAWGMVC